MAGGTRTGFLNHQGGSSGWDFQLQYGPSKHNVANVYLPQWGSPPSLEAVPAYYVDFKHKGGGWNNQGLDALYVNKDSYADVIALLVSNVFYGIVVTHDCRPAANGLPPADSVERVLGTDISDDAAHMIQHVRTVLSRDWENYGMDRPLTTDPEFSMCDGGSSGGHRIITSQMRPDGAYPYARRMTSDTLYPREFSHVCNPLIVSITQTTLTGFSKGGAGWTWYTAYGDFALPGNIFGNQDDTVWDDIPPWYKFQLDLGYYAVPDNPRAHEVGFYFTGDHVSATVPRGSLHNDPTGADPRSFVNRFWLLNGSSTPAPIECIRPIVSNVESIAGSGTGTFRHDGAGGATWVSQGFQVGDVVTTYGFGPAHQATNDHYYVSSFANGNLDMIVQDPQAKVETAAAAAGQQLTGSALADPHDEGMSYIGDYLMRTVCGNTRGRLRAGGTANTNPDTATAYISNATSQQNDIYTWLTDEFGWWAGDP